MPPATSRQTSRRRSTRLRSDSGRREAAHTLTAEGPTDLATKTEALLASDVSIIEIEELRPLILEGQERGFLTFEQITSCLEEVEVTKEQVVELHAYLEDQGIDVVNAEDGRPAIADGRRFEPSQSPKTPDAHASPRST